MDKLGSFFSCLLMLFLAKPLSGELYLAPSDKVTLSDDYDTIPFPKDSGQGFAYWERNGVVKSTGRNYTAHVAQLSERLPYTFGYRMPTDG